MELEADVYLDKPIYGQGSINIEHVEQIQKPFDRQYDAEGPEYKIDNIKVPDNPQNDQFFDPYGNLVNTDKIYQYIQIGYTCIIALNYIAATKSYTPYYIYYEGLKYNFPDDVITAIRTVFNTQDKFIDAPINHNDIIKDLKTIIKVPVLPEEYSFYDYTGKKMKDFTDIQYYNYDIAPIIYITRLNKYLFILHQVNRPFTNLKPDLDGQIAGINNVYEIDQVYLDILFELPNSNIDFIMNLGFLGGNGDYMFPDYDQHNIIHNMEGDEKYASPKDPNIIKNEQYWIRYSSIGTLISLYADDGSNIFTKEACTIYYDVLYREFNANVSWEFAQMTLDEFQKDVPIIPDGCLFLGWKNSNEIIKQLQVDNNNVFTKYHQRESSKEGFCISTFKPNEEKKNNLFAHTSYSNARMGFDGVCGGYILFDPDKNPDYFVKTEQQLVTKTDFTVKGLQVILPIRDIACFSNFDEYPGALGDIVLKMYLNKQSMVWCQCDPRFTYDISASSKCKNY